MRLLLDTRVFLWAVAEPLRLVTVDAVLTQYSDIVLLI